MKSSRAHTIVFGTIPWVLTSHTPRTQTALSTILEAAWSKHPVILGCHGSTGAATTRFGATTTGSRGSVNPNLSHALVVPSDQCVSTNGRPGLDAAATFRLLEATPLSSSPWGGTCLVGRPLRYRIYSDSVKVFLQAGSK